MILPYFWKGFVSGKKKNKSHSVGVTLHWFLVKKVKNSNAPFRVHQLAAKERILISYRVEDSNLRYLP